MHAPQTDPHLVLYYAPVACSLVPYITLTEAGAAFDVQTVNMGRREHLSADFLRLNPKHRVPVLVIDGEALTENVAIQIWIARQFPGAQLLPTGPLQEARAIALLAWCASGIHPTLTPNARPERYCDLPDSADSVRRCAQKMLFGYLRLADDLLVGREWFFDHFTAVDAYFFWCFRRATLFHIDVSAFSACQAHFDRMLQRPSVRKLIAFEADTLEQFKRSP